MKRAMFWGAIFIAGGLIAFINNFISVLWIGLEWRKPIADWLRSIGLPQVIGYWSLVWINLPDWLMASILGLIIGLVFARKRPLAVSLVAVAGFIVLPHICILLFSVHPWFFFGLDAALRGFAWSLIPIPLAILTAWLASRGRRTPAVEPAQPPSAA